MAAQQRTSLIGLWIPLATAVGLIALALGWLRSPVPLPATLVLAFLGLAMCSFARAPQDMKLTDWILIGPYLLAVGGAFGRDLQLASQPWMIPLMIGAAALAALTPYSRRAGTDAAGFVLAVLLYSATLVVRSSVPAQEVALFAASAVLRVALSRVRRVEATAGRQRNSIAWLILAPAVRVGLLAAGIVLMATPIVTAANRLRTHFDPEIQAMVSQIDTWSDEAKDMARNARRWLEEWSSNLPPPDAPLPRGLIESMISGQQPLDAGPVPGMELNKPIRVQEPDQLRFDRDVRDRLRVAGMPEEYVLASVRSARPLPFAPYLRRAVFEVYQGGAWSFPQPNWAPWSDRTVLEVPGRLDLWVSSEPGPAGEIFVPSPFLGTSAQTQLSRDRAGNLRAGLRGDVPVTIGAASSLGPFDWNVPVNQRFPESLHQVPAVIRDSPEFQRVRAAIRSRAAQGEPLPVAAAGYCRETFRYTRTPNHTPGADPVLEFLRTGRGFCQHYASLCALVLRSEGIPARLGAGLAFGAPREGAWLYGLDNGHAWVELWVEPFGWVPLDPTAGAVNLDTGAPSPPYVGSGPRNPPNPGQDGSDQPGGLEEHLMPAPQPPSSARAPGDPSGQPPGNGRSGAEPTRVRPTPDLSRIDREGLQALLRDRTPGSGSPKLPADGTPTPPPAAAEGRPAASPAASPVASASPKPALTPGSTPMATGDAFATPVVPRANPGEEPQEKGLADTLEQLVQMGDWIALGVGALMSLFALYTLKRRVRVEQSLGDRPGLTEEEADLELAWLRHNLEETRSPREAVRLLFELFSRQMAAWGYGRASHETERDYAIAVERALGGKDLKVMDPPVNLVEETRYGGLLPSQAQLESLDRALVDIVLQVGRRLGLKAEGLGGFLKRGSWLPKKLNIVN